MVPPHTLWADWKLGSIEAALNTDPRGSKSKVGKHKESRVENQVTAARGESKSSVLLPPLGAGVENLPWSGLPRKEEIRSGRLAHQVPKTMQ